MARSSADGDGRRGGVVRRDWCVGGEVDGGGAGVGDAGGRAAGAAVGDFACPFGGHFVSVGAAEWKVEQEGGGDYN